MIHKTIFFLTLILLCSLVVSAQSLLEELEQEPDTLSITEQATFKGTRLINGHSVETDGEGVLSFLISHRFGRLNEGAYEFFGLDDSNIRLGLEYGLTDRLNVGIGRSSFEKVIDAFIKYQLIRQQSGGKVVPLSLTVFSSMAINTLRSQLPERELNFRYRVDYTYQLLLARKFSSRLSLQLMPTWLHRNLVAKADMENDLYVLGMGGRYKLSKRVALNLEYYYRLNAEAEEDFYYNPIAIGFDIETGGHVFQLQLTNARAMIEEGFLSETSGDFFSGDIHFGFNISRVFQLK
ncbi:DUF5777 family beta-barrel protein [Porifericola rhodea]|uniref:DUF5777 family beta-barrel protein n=1 Tax=Porifericola rhodea TaxID=930972 RepID=UPI0026657C33|nr:DUF5777 family beta-barrel protein [Porifericola rhodea]WKN29569.1 DUF5777 family beta-barrel protein [Porifericola rhodea]